VTSVLIVPYKYSTATVLLLFYLVHYSSVWFVVRP